MVSLTFRARYPKIEKLCDFRITVSNKEDMTTEPGEQLDRATKLALDRTRLAEERTVLAWVRTAASLITFGFAIYSFFAIPNGAGYTHATHLGPRIFALTLIGIGLLSLLLASVQRERAESAMIAFYPGRSRVSMGAVVAGLVACLGILALLLVLLRV